MIIYFTMGTYLNGTWHWHMLCRVIFANGTSFYIQMTRVYNGDEIDLIVGYSMVAIATMFIELNYYINYKAKAQLFLKIKTIE